MNYANCLLVGGVFDGQRIALETNADGFPMPRHRACEPPPIARVTPATATAVYMRNMGVVEYQRCMRVESKWYGDTWIYLHSSLNPHDVLGELLRLYNPKGNRDAQRI